jgi:hypothetical protein
LKSLRQDPGKILRVKVENLWNFWVRAENRQKTLLLILMQVPFLGAVMASLIILLHRRQLHRVKFGLIIVLVLWAEHFLVFAWGRFSLDLVPILGLIFGLGAAARLRASTDSCSASDEQRKNRRRHAGVQRRANTPPGPAGVTPVRER